jgi:hypothetical protein
MAIEWIQNNKSIFSVEMTKFSKRLDVFSYLENVFLIQISEPPYGLCSTFIKPPHSAPQPLPLTAGPILFCLQNKHNKLTLSQTSPKGGIFMKSLLLIVAISLIAPHLFADSKFVCVNKNALLTKLEVSIGSTTAEMSANKAQCTTEYISYNPTSKKYKGWVRVAPVDKNGCESLGAELVGNNQFGEGMAIFWLSISQEMQNGQEGFAQLGVRNDWDPGAGDTGKVNLRCYPK